MLGLRFDSAGLSPENMGLSWRDSSTEQLTGSDWVVEFFVVDSTSTQQVEYDLWTTDRTR